jgi:hypothetical protein
MPGKDRPKDRGGGHKVRSVRGLTKFELYGQEMIEKPVARSGKSGRVYVPLEWLGKNIKIIRVD